MKYISISLIVLGFLIFIDSVEEKSFKKVMTKLIISFLTIMSGIFIGIHYE